MGFLPINRREMQRLGWEQPDFVYVTGDAYVDHPSFGHAIISRILESHGYKVAILPQPDWRKMIKPDPISVRNGHFTGTAFTAVPVFLCAD